MDSVQTTGASKVAALLEPESIAILGARDNPSGWTARIFANLQRFGFRGPVWPVNPSRTEIWGVPCYRDLTSLPGRPDHLVVMLNAAMSADALRDGAKAGARSATLYAAGFGESGTEEGRRREAELRHVIAETGLAVSGPNCLGNLSARARLLTLPDDRVRALVPGPVAMVGQSGTTTPAIARMLIDRGIESSFVVTSGNEIGLNTADYVDYFVGVPEVRVIFCLIEALRAPQAFLAACRRARDAGKAVVALKMGVSEGGRAAALAHTGSLAGSIQAFDAVAGAAGVIRVESADQAANMIEYLAHASLPPKPGVAALVYSGSVRGLAIDAAARHGVPLVEFSRETVQRIRDALGEDMRIANPLDAASYVQKPKEVLIGVLAAMASDPQVGSVLFQEDIPPDEGHNDANKRRAQRVMGTLEALDGVLATQVGKPVALLSATSYDVTGFGRDARRRFPHLPVLNEPDRAFRTLRAINDYAARRAAPARDPARTGAPGPVASSLRGRARAEPVALDEPTSKTLLREYGIAVPREALACTGDEAVAAARAIGYPVVLKGVCARLTHKSDAGAVMLGLRDDDAVRRAFAAIHANVAAYDATLTLDGVLVAQSVGGGIELVIGINRDPEMGPVVMFGLGGIWLELFRDVSFAAPGLDAAEAERMISATKAGTLLAGYRGAPPADRAAVVTALVAAGRMAAELGDAIEAVDINPFVALPDREGGCALDALVVLRSK